MFEIQDLPMYSYQENSKWNFITVISGSFEEEERDGFSADLSFNLTVEIKFQNVL